jgi:hypothetical protein
LHFLVSCSLLFWIVKLFFNDSVALSQSPPPLFYPSLLLPQVVLLYLTHLSSSHKSYFYLSLAIDCKGKSQMNQDQQSDPPPSPRRNHSAPSSLTEQPPSLPSR